MHNKMFIAIFIVIIMIFSSFAFIFNSNEINNKIDFNDKNLSIDTNKSFNVNPGMAYKNEPAPMGLADYGIGYDNMPYKYNTTSFLGSVKINNISVLNNTTNSKCMTFQFNINLVFNNSNNEYVYWVQDVAFLNTSSGFIYFIDNIWNVTSYNANMYNSTIKGNGTIGNSSGTHFYYACASSSLPGNYVNIKYPATINFMVNSTIKNGMPELGLMYNDGYGWVTYDNPIFKFAKNLTEDYGFVVDGYNYEPDSYSFYDAELILGGPGDGSSTIDLKSSINLSIQYWNNHNYQEITNAFNYGSDTAETIDNVISTAEYYTSNGSIFENLVPGNGNLCQICNSHNIALLNISMPFSNGYVYVNGTEHRFINNDINLTIAPGKYNVKIYNGKILYKNLTVNLSSGEYLPLSVARKYNVTFIETGLPEVTTWYVNLTNGMKSGAITGKSYSFLLANETYNYTISTENKIYKPLKSSGTLTVNDKNLTENIKFTKLTYKINFTETGLPIGVKWYVNLTDNQHFSSISSIISFNETNGTYNYKISTTYKIYGPFIYSGIFNINGSIISKSVTFIKVTYKVTFIETGLPEGTTWYVNLTNGNSYKSNNNTITFNEINGTYNFTIGTDSNYNANITYNSFTVNGNNINEAIKFSHNTDITGIITLIAVVAIAMGFAGFIILRKRK